MNYHHGDDIALANNSVSDKLPFFMCPHAEISGQEQDSLPSVEFSYKIISAKLVGTLANL